MFLLLARPKRKCRRPKFSLDWHERNTSDRWSKLFLCLEKPKVFATGAAEAQVSTNQKFVVTGASEALVTSDVFFSDWRERCKNERWQKYFWIWRDRQFLDWRDRSLTVRGTKQKCLPTAIILQLNWPKHEWPLTEIFCVWQDLNCLRLARRKQKCPTTEFFSD